jgi:hypothetical protein
MPAVEDGRQLVFGDHFIERPGHAVLRVEALHRGVELEALDAVLLDQLACLARAHAALVRIDAGEGDHHVAVLRRGLGDFFVGDAAVADVRLGIDGEHHQADLALAVIGDGLVYGRPVRVLEILVGGALVGLEPRDPWAGSRRLRRGCGCRCCDRVRRGKGASRLRALAFSIQEGPMRATTSGLVWATAAISDST